MLCSIKVSAVYNYFFTLLLLVVVVVVGTFLILCGYIAGTASFIVEIEGFHVLKDFKCCPITFSSPPLLFPQTN